MCVYVCVCVCVCVCDVNNRVVILVVNILSVQLLCAERNAPCQRDLAIDKAEPPASAAK